MATAPSAEEQRKIDLIEPRLQGLWGAAGVEWETLVRLSDAKVLTTTIFRWVADGTTGLRAFLASKGIGDAIEQAKIMSVHENLKISSEVEVRDAATKAVAKMPPQLAIGELPEAKKFVREAAPHPHTCRVPTGRLP